MTSLLAYKIVAWRSHERPGAPCMLGSGIYHCDSFFSLFHPYSKRDDARSKGFHPCQVVVGAGSNEICEIWWTSLTLKLMRTTTNARSRSSHTSFIVVPPRLRVSAQRSISAVAGVKPAPAGVFFFMPRGALHPGAGMITHLQPALSSPVFYYNTPKGLGVKTRRCAGGRVYGRQLPAWWT